MPRSPSDKPTEAELEILRVLWDHGPSTVREVNEAMNRTKPTGYTTTLKLMQIMREKGLLHRDGTQHPQVYEPAISEVKAQRRFVKDMLDRVFEGSTSRFVMQVLSTKKASAKEMQEIRRALRKLEKEQ